MGYVLALLAYLLWAFSSTVLLRGVPLPGPTATCAGSAIGALCMMALVRKKDLRACLDVARLHPFRTLGQAAGYAACSLAYQWAIKVTTVANASLTHSLQPIFTCLLFVPLLRRRMPSKSVFVSVVVGFFGLTVLLAPQLSWNGSVFGIALGISSAVFYSATLVNLGFFMARMELKSYLACMMALGAVLTLPFAIAEGGTMPDIGGIACLVGFGVCCFVVANLFFMAASKRIPDVHLGTLGYLEPVASIAFAALWLHEPLTPTTVIGGTLVLASGLLIVLDRPKQRATAS